jgi:phage terminase small subunit
MANQYDPDPRQTLFLTNYLDPKSETFSNAYQSAVKAGYSEEYATNITGQMPQWLSENIRDEDLITQAIKNLKQFISEEEEDKKIKADMTKFTLERLNKSKYSTRQEVTGSDGKDLPAPIIQIKREE